MHGDGSEGSRVGCQRIEVRWLYRRSGTHGVDQLAEDLDGTVERKGSCAKHVHPASRKAAAPGRQRLCGQRHHNMAIQGHKAC